MRRDSNEDLTRQHKIEISGAILDSKSHCLEHQIAGTMAISKIEQAKTLFLRNLDRLEGDDLKDFCDWAQEVLDETQYGSREHAHGGHAHGHDEKHGDHDDPAIVELDKYVHVRFFAKCVISGAFGMISTISHCTLMPRTPLRLHSYTPTHILCERGR